MNRIEELFKKKRNILSIYFTAGFPELKDTVPVIKTLAQGGADMIEIGIPFSDPLADGPVIQQSSELALKNGMTLSLLFDQLNDIRKETAVSNTSLLLMGYLNPVLQFGIAGFCEKAKACGIDGVIIPDLPLDVYLQEYKELFQKAGIKVVFLVTPQTSDERIRLIDKHSEGFIYLVSSASTTGVKGQISEEQLAYFARIRAMKLSNPVLIGFGIADKAGFNKACEYAEGAIIGSAFVKVLGQRNGLTENIKKFISPLRQEMPL